MVRNCIAAIVLWLALAIGYAVFLWGDAPVFAAIALASVAWVGLVIVNNGRYALRDWKARNRMAQGERPRDGELVAATGEIRPVLDRLQAPFSGRECVFYMYNAGPHRGKNNASRDYAGFGFARCSVYTPHGSFSLGSFPVIEGFPAEPVDLERVRQYIEATQFESIEGMRDMVQKMTSLYRQAPPLRYDIRIGEPGALQEADERIIPTGMLVTAIGRYDAASNSIVSDTKEKGFLRVKPGGSPYAVSAFPAEAAVKFAGGLLLVIGATVVAWLISL